MNEILFIQNVSFDSRLPYRRLLPKLVTMH
jgi:hypothetical protein